MKRLAQLLVSLCVRVYDVTKAAILRVTGRTVPGRCVTLYYHGIHPELRPAFARQMDTVIRLTTVLPATYSGPLEPGRQYSVITFDDGFRSYREVALPEMEQRQVHSTIFVPSGNLGMPPQWIRRPDHPALKETVMTESELCRIAQHPLVMVGSHSVHHPDFLKIDPQAALSELSESKNRLESILGRPVPLFSFPHGRFSKENLAQAVQAGYERTFGIQPIPIDNSAHASNWGRVAVEPDDWPIEFHLKLLGAYRWMASRHHL